MEPSGAIARVWRAPGEDDSWHVNCLLQTGGDLLVCAFGRFTRHREWNEHRPDPTGLIFNLRTGEDVVTGLAQPHTPRLVDGALVVCNSATHELLRVDVDCPSKARTSLRLDGFTRGLAVSDEFLFVGESAPRTEPDPSSTARVVVVRRDTWRVIDRIPVPAREIYDLVLAPDDLLEGVRRGFNTNHVRVAEQNQYALFQQAGIEPVRLWASGDRLPREAFKARVTARLPERFVTGAAIEVACVVENLSGAFFVSAAPYPVQLGYRWLDASSGEPVDEPSWLRAALSRTAAPGEHITCDLRIVPPSRAGRFVLKLTLVQEFVAWFDDIDQSNAFVRTVDVVESDGRSAP